MSEQPDYSPFPRPWTPETMTQLADYAEAGPVLSAMERDLVEVVRLAALLAPSPAPPPTPEPDAHELLLTLKRIHMTARRALSYGNQATPITPERITERRNEFLTHIVGMCEDAGVDPPSILRASAPVSPAPQRKPCEKYLDAWKVGNEWLAIPTGAVCPRCGFYANEHDPNSSSPAPDGVELPCIMQSHGHPCKVHDKSPAPDGTPEA